MPVDSFFVVLSCQEFKGVDPHQNPFHQPHCAQPLLYFIPNSLIPPLPARRAPQLPATMVFPGGTSRSLWARSSNLLPRLKSLSSKDLSRTGGRHSQPRRGLRSHAQKFRGTGPFASAAGLWPSALTLPATAAAAALVGSSLALAYAKHQQDRQVKQLQDAGTDARMAPRGNLTASGWAKEVAEEPGSIKVLTAEALLAQDHPFLEDDHMVSAGYENCHPVWEEKGSGMGSGHACATSAS